MHQLAHAQRKVLHCLLTTNSKTEMEKLSAEYSTHPVPSGIWGFADSYSGYGTSTQAVAYDTMHNEDLGVFLHLVKGVSDKVQAGPNGEDTSFTETLLHSFVCT